MDPNEAHLTIRALRNANNNKFLLFFKPFSDSVMQYKPVVVKTDEHVSVISVWKRYYTRTWDESSSKCCCWSVAHVPSSTITNPALYPPFVRLYLIHLLHCRPYLPFSLSHSNPFTLAFSFSAHSHFSLSLSLSLSLSPAFVLFWLLTFRSAFHSSIFFSLFFKSCFFTRHLVSFCLTLISLFHSSSFCLFTTSLCTLLWPFPPLTSG